MPVTSQEVRMFICDLSTLVDEGQSVTDSLTNLAQRQPNQDFRQVIEQATQKVSQGQTLSGAMRSFFDVVAPDYTDAIRQGEVNRNLDIVLKQLCCS